jgi:TolA-binding protein
VTPPPRRRPAAPPVVAPAPAPAPAQAPAPRGDAELAAYRHAHQLHFHGAPPAEALDAWDAYLAAYPDGQLALEARYNRALCLVRLKRWPAAIEALTPFASGAMGDYRRDEAAKLLDAIRTQAP